MTSDCIEHTCSSLSVKRCEASKSCVVILSFGSLRNKLAMTHLSSRESEFGTWNNPRRIFPINEDGFGS